MLFRSLRSFLQSHTPFFLMMVLCIFLSSLLMLFGYGLYQDYMLEQKDFDQSSKELYVSSIAQSEDIDRDGYFMNPELIVTKEELDACIARVPEKYLGDSSFFTVYVYAPYATYNLPSPYDYCTCFFYIKDGKYLPVEQVFMNGMDHPGAEGRMFTDEEYSSNAPVINLGSHELTPLGEQVTFFDGKEYTAIAKGGIFREVPYGCLPSDAILNFIVYNAEKPLSFEQYTELKNAFSSIQDRVRIWNYVPFYDEDYWMYNSAMLGALLIAVVAAFNLVVLYHYVLVRRQKSLAIFQLCGCTKGKAIRLYVAESLLLTVPCYCLAALFYHFVLLEPFTRVFPYIDTAYSLRLYATGFGIFVTVCTLAIWILSVWIVSRHSIVERKGGVL